MAKIKHIANLQDSEKEFLKLFDKLTYSRSAWQVWEDLMTVIACSISNAVDRTPDKFNRREEQYGQAIERLGGVEIPAQMLGIITMALEKDSAQDFLGKLYMNLNLGNHWKGQFFTPYNVCRLMAEINYGDGVQAEVERKGYISVCDPCVGAGAMLIAAANAMRRAKVNYQTNAVFVGQDIDRVVAMMAYIQISLIGCPGYIIIGNSLTNPPTGHVLFPKDTEEQDVWITPMFTTDIWNMRRKWCLLEQLCGTVTTKKTVEKGHFFMFFDFKEKESTVEMNGFNENNISEQNKEALQSETEQGVSKATEAEVTDSEEENTDDNMLPTEDETMKENDKTNKQKAKEKLEKELKETKNKAFANPIISYLLKRCEEDEGLAQDVIQKHKTWKKCFAYISQQARNQAEGGCAAVRDNVVYEWSEDYYHKDDKEEEEKKDKKEAEREAKQKKEAESRKNKAKETPRKAASVPQKEEEVPKGQPKPKKSGKDMDGQLDIFSMIGI